MLYECNLTTIPVESKVLAEFKVLKNKACRPYHENLLLQKNTDMIIHVLKNVFSGSGQVLYFLCLSCASSLRLFMSVICIKSFFIYISVMCVNSLFIYVCNVHQILYYLCLSYASSLTLFLSVMCVNS